MDVLLTSRISDWSHIQQRCVYKNSNVMFKYSLFKFSGNGNKEARKPDPEYEEIGLPITQKNHTRQDVNTKLNCHLCGCLEAAVVCHRCNDQYFCLSCDDMYHRHPKRSAHVRKATQIAAIVTAPLKPPLPLLPPLPPKVTEAPLSPPPMPPPRKNKRPGMFSSFGKLDEIPANRMRRSSVGGELLCPRPSQQGVTTINDRQEANVSSKSVIPYKMVNRPLPPTPYSNRGCVPKADSVGNLSHENIYPHNVNSSIINSPVEVSQPGSEGTTRMAQVFSKPPTPVGPSSVFSSRPSTGQHSGHPRKFSLQQFAPSEEIKASFIEPTPGALSWEGQPPKIPQKLRSQSISDEQWNRTILNQSQGVKGYPTSGAASEMGDAQNAHRGYTMGFGGRPYIPPKGMTASASVSNLHAMHDRTNSFQQMNMVPYDPNMMWMSCPHCHPHHGYQQSPTGNNGMKRAASNVSMNQSSVASDASGYPWSMPAHSHPPVPFYHGYYPQGHHQQMHHPTSIRGSATSIPDSMHSVGKRYFSPAGSEMSSRRSHKPNKPFNPVDREGGRSKPHSRRQSIDTDESLSSADSDEKMHSSKAHAKPKTSCLSWQCHHCTFINPGYTQICGMCSKPSSLQDDRAPSHSGRQRKDKRQFRRGSKDGSELGLPNYDHKDPRSRRDYRDQRTRLPSSSKSLRGWSSKKSINKSSFASDSPSLSDSPFEDDRFAIEKQLKSLNITPGIRPGNYDGLQANISQRIRDKQRRPEGKNRFRNRSKSVSVRTGNSENLSGMTFSLTSSSSEEDRLLRSDSYSPDELEERRISSLEETIMASIMLKQQNRINLSVSKAGKRSSDEKSISNPREQDIYSTVTKRKEISLENDDQEKNTAVSLGDIHTHSSLHKEDNAEKLNRNESITPQNRSISRSKRTSRASSRKASPTKLRVTSSTFPPIEIDDPIDYIDASSDNHSDEPMHIYPSIPNTLGMSSREQTTIYRDSPPLHSSEDVTANYVEESLPERSIKDLQQEIVKLLPVALNEAARNEIERKLTNSSALLPAPILSLPPAPPLPKQPTQVPASSQTTAECRMSPMSVSSSDIQFYSPQCSPVHSVGGNLYDSMDKGFEAFENSLEYEESSGIPSGHPLGNPVSMSSAVSKSLSDQAISGKFQFQISSQSSKKESNGNSTSLDSTTRQLTVKEIVDKKMRAKTKQQGLQIVQYFREAEQKGYHPEDVSIAMGMCEEANPVEWLEENWSAMIDTVTTLATNYGVERAPNDVGKISSSEARDSLRLRRGNIWAAVTECVEQRQKKYNEIHGRGNFSPHDIVRALEIAGGNVAEAVMGLAKINPIGKLLQKIWQSSMGGESTPRKDEPHVEEKKTANTAVTGIEAREEKQSEVEALENTNHRISHSEDIATANNRIEDNLDEIEDTTIIIEEEPVYNSTVTTESEISESSPSEDEVTEAYMTTLDDMPHEEEDPEPYAESSSFEEQPVTTEDSGNIEEPIVVDGAKVREHGGIVTVQKATKIVALAITKAMARESAVRDEDDSDSESSIAGSSSHEPEPQERSSSEVSHIENEDTDSSESDDESKAKSPVQLESVSKDNQKECLPTIRKGTIPPAVVSFVGPIFVPDDPNGPIYPIASPKQSSLPKKMPYSTARAKPVTPQKESSESTVRRRMREIEMSSRLKQADTESESSDSESSHEMKPIESQMAGPSKTSDTAVHLLPQRDTSTESDTEDEEMSANVIQVGNASLAAKISPTINDSLTPVKTTSSPIDSISKTKLGCRNKLSSGGSAMESLEVSDEDLQDEQQAEVTSTTSGDPVIEAELNDEMNPEPEVIPVVESDQPPNVEEASLQNPEIVVDTPAKEVDDAAEITADESQKLEQLNFDRTVRRLLAEGHTPTYEKAELAAHLLALSFEEGDSISAAVECSSIYSAMRFLRQECELCAERYSVGKMVSMLHCTHRCCYQCATNYFTFQIKAKNIRELRCPFCSEPDLEDNEEVTMEYFNNLDILLKGIIDSDTHELFQRKVRDLSLMKDPNFRWCNKCSSGYIANPRARKLICPDCKEITCSQCREVWELQHEGITCEEFNAWKTDNDPESQATAVARHLAENGITCPNCRFTYALAKGGCMHFTCTECKFEFCSGCSEPFKQGIKCTVGPYCERLGLHAHHPRNCLFYLRDKEPEQLQQLLTEHNIAFDTEMATDNDTDVKVSCRVLEQKETLSGFRDDACGRAVLKAHAGLCNLHYVEYLVERINNHALDPVTIFDEADMRVCLRRNGKTVPVRRWESEKLYRNKLIKLIKEQLPLS